MPLFINVRKWASLSFTLDLLHNPSKSYKILFFSFKNTNVKMITFSSQIENVQNFENSARTHQKFLSQVQSCIST